MKGLVPLIRIRFLILFMTTICLTMLIANLVTFNFTIICMVEDSTFSNSPSFNHSNSVGNSSAIQKYERFDWTKNERSTLFSSFAWGAILGALPISYIQQKYGIRRQFFIAGIVSGIVVSLFPYAAHLGIPYLIGCRVILGVAYASHFPSNGYVTAHWATIRENGLFMGILGSATQLSMVVAMPLSGWLCTSSYGWPSVFYTHGIITTSLFLIWGLLYRNSPNEHPFISRKEVELIGFGKGKEGGGHEKRGKVPWKGMIGSPAVWAILISCTGNMLAIHLVILYCAIYLKTVLDFDISSVSFLSALPTLFQFAIKVLGGLSSDVIPLNNTVKVRFFNGLALFGMAAFLLGLGFVPQNAPNTAVTLLICATSILGFHSGGFFKSTSLVARQYSPLIMGLVQLIANLTWLTIPYIVESMTEYNTIGEWKTIWIGTAVILAASNLPFCFFGSGNPASWVTQSPTNHPERDDQTYSKGNPDPVILGKEGHPLLTAL